MQLESDLYLNEWNHTVENKLDFTEEQEKVEMEKIKEKEEQEEAE